MARNLDNLFSLIIPDQLKQDAPLPAISQLLTFDDLGDFIEERQRIQRKVENALNTDLKVDFTSFANHVAFDSALSKFTIAKTKILTQYPFEGDSEEQDLFTLSASLYENYVLEQWPRGVGYLQLDGATQRVTASDNQGNLYLGSSSLYVSTFLIPKATGRNTVLQYLSASAGQKFGYELLLSGTSNLHANFNLYSGSTVSSISGYYSSSLTGNWCNVAAMYDQPSQMLYMYIGGQRASSASVSLNPINLNPAIVMIGSGTSGYNMYSGSLDEIRILHTASEIFHLKNYNRPITSEDYVKLYYKFNEGIVGTASIDTVVIDYSKSKLHGQIVNYSSNARVSGTSMQYDPGDPILYSFHSGVIAFSSSQETSASIFDATNRNYILRLLPEKILEDDQDANGLLISFSLAMARYYDELKMYVDQFDNLRIKNYTNVNETPDVMMPFLKKYFGWKVTDHFGDANPLSFFFGENVLSTGSLDQHTLQDIRNQFWSRILNNLPYLYKTKGKRNNIETFFNVLGINSNLINLKEYGYLNQNSINDEYINKQKPFSLLGFGTSSFGSASYVHVPSLLSSSAGAPEWTIETFAQFPWVSASYSGTLLTGSIWGLANTSSGKGVQLRWNIPTINSSVGSLSLVGNDGQIFSASNLPIFEGQFVQLAAGLQANTAHPFICYQILTNNTILSTGSFVGSAPFSGVFTNGFYDFYMGASDGTVFTARTQGYYGQYRYWTRQLSASEIAAHTLNNENIGTNDPLELPNPLLAHWPLNENKGTTGAGELTAVDVSQHGFYGTGSNFPANINPYNKFLLDYNFISPSADLKWTENKVRIRNKNTLSISDLGNDTNKVVLEFNLVDALNEDIAKIFSTIDDFNNVIGAPINKYRDNYEDLESLRRVYFKRLTDSLNFTGFFKLFQWFDRKLASAIKQLLPARVDFIGGEFVVESHFLERNKYQYKYPIFKTPKDVSIGDIGQVGDNTSGSAEGVYIGQTPSAPGSYISTDDPIMGTYVADYWRKQYKFPSPVTQGTTYTNLFDDNVANGGENGTTAGFYSGTFGTYGPSNGFYLSNPTFSTTNIAWQGTSGIVFDQGNPLFGGPFVLKCSASLEPFTEYTFSFYIRTNGGEGFCEIGIVDGDSNHLAFADPNFLTTTYQRQSVQFSTLGNGNVEFSFDPGVRMYYDGFMVTEGTTLYPWIEGTFSDQQVFESSVPINPRVTTAVIEGNKSPQLLCQWDDGDERIDRSQFFSRYKLSGDDSSYINNSFIGVNFKNEYAQRMLNKQLFFNTDGRHTGTLMGPGMGNGFVMLPAGIGENEEQYHGLRKHYPLVIRGLSGSSLNLTASIFNLSGSSLNTIELSQSLWDINNAQIDTGSFSGQFFSCSSNTVQEKYDAVMSFYVSGVTQPFNSDDINVKFKDNNSSFWSTYRNVIPHGVFFSSSSPNWQKFESRLFISGAYQAPRFSFNRNNVHWSVSSSAGKAYAFKDFKLRFEQPLSSYGASKYTLIDNQYTNKEERVLNRNIMPNLEDGVTRETSYFTWQNLRDGFVMNSTGSLCPAAITALATTGSTYFAVGSYLQKDAPTLNNGGTNLNVAQLGFNEPSYDINLNGNSAAGLFSPGFQIITLGAFNFFNLRWFVARSQDAGNTWKLVDDWCVNSGSYFFNIFNNVFGGEFGTVGNTIWGSQANAVVIDLSGNVHVGGFAPTNDASPLNAHSALIRSSFDGGNTFKDTFRTNGFTDFHGYLPIPGLTWGANAQDASVGAMDVDLNGNIYAAINYAAGGCSQNFSSGTNPGGQSWSVRKSSFLSSGVSGSWNVLFTMTGSAYFVDGAGNKTGSFFISGTTKQCPGAYGIYLSPNTIRELKCSRINAEKFYYSGISSTLGAFFISGLGISLITGSNTGYIAYYTSSQDLTSYSPQFLTRTFGPSFSGSPQLRVIDDFALDSKDNIAYSVVAGKFNAGIGGFGSILICVSGSFLNWPTSASGVLNYNSNINPQAPKPNNNIFFKADRVPVTVDSSGLVYFAAKVQDNTYIMSASRDGTNFRSYDTMNLTSIGRFYSPTSLQAIKQPTGNDLIVATGDHGLVRAGVMTSNSASYGPRSLARSIGYFASENNNGLNYSLSKLNNVSEFPHYGGLFQIPSLVLGTRDTGKIGQDDNSIIQVRHIGSIVQVMWPSQARLDSAVAGAGEMSIGQSPGNLGTTFTFGDLYQTANYDHLSLYCYLQKNQSGTIDDVVITVQRRPLSTVGFVNDQTVEYSVSGSFTEARYRDIMHTKGVDYGDLTMPVVSYVIDIPLVNVGEVRIGARQKNGQATPNQNFLVWGRYINSKLET